LPSRSRGYARERYDGDYGRLDATGEGGPLRGGEEGGGDA
jgi:hypothetical protein